MNQKTIAALACFTAATAISVTANDIEPGKDKYTARFTPNAITVDGDLSDWPAGVPVIADPRFAVPKGSGTSANPNYVLFEEYNGGTWSGPSDQTSAVQVVYDADNVYFGFVVTDDFHENGANSPWNGDSVQLMIANAERNAQIALYNYALGGIEGALGESIVNHEAGPGGTEGVVVRNEATKKTYYEIKLPKASLALGDLTPGTKFGLGMAINDGDEAQPGQRGWGGLGAHALVFGKSPGETAEITLAATTTTVEVLGVGAESLLGGDLTDPENDGEDALGAATGGTWNWKAITASIEPDFEGGENAFNIFDNKVGGGNDKWCCDDPTVANPVWVAVEFANPISLTHFTVTSGNDAADRDPTNWAIQGSNDGANYTDIYRGPSTPPWTARNQVVKFTLPFASPSYRMIRYIAYETPGTLHQLNEVELFGTIGSGTTGYLSAINPSINGFTFNANDVGTSVIVPASAKLTIDGAPAIVTSTRNGEVVSFSYTPTTPFAPGSAHTYSIEVKDALGNTLTSTGTFTTPAYGLLTPADKVTADTAAPGFRFVVHQNNNLTETTVARAQAQLAGLLGANFADPVAVGPAAAEATVPANPNAPLTFIVPTVINMEQTGVDAGVINPNDMIPGIPGVGDAGGNNGIAAEITTFVELPAGLHRFTFNSDDGFRTTVGAIDDVFRGTLAGEFNAGRGATDTSFSIYAAEAGIYPMRTIWFEGGGGANLEWRHTKADGTEVLLNDTENGGFRAYNAVSAGAVQTAVLSISPGANATGVSADAPLVVRIRNGTPAIDLSTLQLSLNGAPVTVTPTTDGNIITLNYQAPRFGPQTTNTATISYTAAGGVQRSETWTFVVANYQTLLASERVTADTTKPGFIWNVHQNASANQGGNLRALKQLAGEYGYNYADPAAVGTALAEGVIHADTNMPIMFEVETVVNWDQTGAEAGEIPGNTIIPGIPGLNNLLTGAASAPTDGIAGEIITYIDLPAGKNTFVFNSDDGFRTYSGNALDLFQAKMLAEFDAGRGASDTVYDFFVDQAGVYQFRTIWFEGGGGANLEWKVVKADGTRALINDRENGGRSAYRAATASVPAAITKVSPWPNYNRVSPEDPIEVSIQEGSTALDANAIKIFVNDVLTTSTAIRSGKTITAKTGANNFTPNSTNTVRVEFGSGATARSQSWSFAVPNVIADKLHSYPGLLVGRAAIGAAGSGRTGAAADTAYDSGTAGAAPAMLVTDADLLAALAAATRSTDTKEDTLTVSFWGKKANNLDSSAFWFDSDTANSTYRGFQAHVPWSNGSIYYDTSGCCDPDATRIDKPVNAETVEGFDATYWSKWHHFVFVKAGASKQIYIDGILFHSGGAIPLPTDWTRLWIGAIGGGPDAGSGTFNGLIDDFAIYGSALSEADIQKLFTGTAPDALGTAANALAYWDFNGAPPVDRPTLNIARTGNSITITWAGTGFRLMEASAITGPWTPVAGVVGNSYTVTNPTGNKFYQLVNP